MEVLKGKVKVQKSYKQIMEFIQIADMYINQDEIKTRLKYALGKVLRALDSNLKDYRKQVEEIKVKHCNKDKNGSLLYEKTDKGLKNFLFGKKGYDAQKKEIDKLYESKITVKPFYATEVPKDFDYDSYQEFFEEFVLPPLKVAKKKFDEMSEEEYLAQ